MSRNNGSGPFLKPAVEQFPITLSISKPEKDLLNICKQLPVLGMIATLDSDNWWKAFIFVRSGICNDAIFGSTAVVFSETSLSVLRLIFEVSMKCSLNSKFVCHRASASILFTGSSWRAICLVVMRGRVLLSKSKQIIYKWYVKWLDSKPMISYYYNLELGHNRWQFMLSSTTSYA